MKRKIRTDLAMEERELWMESAADATALNGVSAKEETVSGYKVSRVEVLNDSAAAELCKPIGKYFTVELDKLLRRDENSFPDAVKVISQLLRELLPESGSLSALVVGLGNKNVTPDAIGPITLHSILVTRHLKEHMPNEFAGFNSVCAVETGVLGTTGIESAALVSMVSGNVKPDIIVVVDALASRNMSRLCKTVQFSDTGIVPGSGVFNSRTALNKDTLGIPVISVGVPTVVDAATIASGSVSEDERNALDGLFVTPRDIDVAVRDISKLIGYCINCALHPGLTVEDVDMLVS